MRRSVVPLLKLVVILFLARLCYMIVLLVVVSDDYSRMNRQVRSVTLRLADSQPVCLGAEPHWGS